jgi:hypothetical protein
VARMAAAGLPVLRMIGGRWLSPRMLDLGLNARYQQSEPVGARRHHPTVKDRGRLRLQVEGCPGAGGALTEDPGGFVGP